MGAGGLRDSKVSRVWIRSARDLAEEEPVAYKGVDEVVMTYDVPGLVRLGARLRSLAVVKG